MEEDAREIRSLLTAISGSIFLLLFLPGIMLSFTVPLSRFTCVYGKEVILPVIYICTLRNSLDI